jgi:hypothetical protein
MALHVRGPRGESESGGKLGLYSAISTAIIGAVATIVVGWLNHNNSSEASVAPAAATTITPTAKQTSDSGSAYRFVIDGTGNVTVSGSAQPNVVGMYVVIGPKPSGGFWGGYANVLNEQWRADVRTDPPWQNYPIEVRPYYGPSGGATRPNAFKFTFQGTEPTTPPPTPPDEILKCVEQSGPNCFKGPEFGPPSVYQSNQTTT